MKTLGSYEVKSRFSEILRDVERGETVVITRRGQEIARLVPAGEAQRRRGDAMERWRAVRDRVLPLGMTMKEAVEEGRRY